MVLTRVRGAQQVAARRAAPGRSRWSIPFARSERSTIGVEWELALVDADSGDLRQVAQTVLDAVAPPGGGEHPTIKQELLLNTVEIVTGVCRTVAEAGRDLQRSIEELRPVTDPLRVELDVRRHAPVRPVDPPEGHRQAAVRDAHRPHPVVGPADADLRRARARRHRGPRQGAADPAGDADLLPAPAGAVARRRRSGAARTPATRRTGR